MILKKLEIENFRQFYGKQEIVFSDGERNTTVVLGINNAGKTGVYRALMFGLYGDIKLAQDSKNADVHLVNFKALKEDNLKEDNMVDGNIIVHIENNDAKYIIKRSVRAIKTQNKIQERVLEASLDYINSSGEYFKDYKNTTEEVDKVINSILDYNIKEFFLFDGEKIENLARSDKESRKEVRKGIVKLMEIDKLKESRDILRKTLRNEEKRIAKAYENDNIHVLIKDREDIENNIEKDKEILKELNKNLGSLKNEKDMIDEELSEAEEIQGFISEKDKLLIKISNIDDQLKVKKENLSRYLFRDSSFLLLADYSRALNKRLKNYLSEQDDLISIHILEKSLENEVCLCCNQSITQEESIYYIKEMMKNFKPKDLTKVIEDTHNVSYSKLEKESKIKNNLKEELEAISKLNMDLKQAKKNLEELEYKISKDSNVEENLKANIERKETIIVEEERVKNKIFSLNTSIKDYENELNDLERKITDIQKSLSNQNFREKKCDFLRNLVEKIDIKYDDYVAKTREVLSKRTTKTFKNLIDFEETSLVDQIIIGDNYELKIYNKDMIEVTEDISQGQQMIVALSFITSLASIASKSNIRVDYPLFMDTPFGRLSKENRSNLIKNLPKLANQWIPLFTDTDYTEYERSIFKEENIIGKSYQIREIDDEHSIIEESNI